jgi:hypothetical protein
MRLELRTQPLPENPERMNIAFRAGTGGLHTCGELTFEG